MPHPSAPNAYPSLAYPSAPDGAAPTVTSPGFVGGAATPGTVGPGLRASLTSASFTPAAGELLVVKAGTAATAATVQAVAGGALTWTRLVNPMVTAGEAPAAIWAAPVPTGQAAAMTVSVTFANTSTNQAVLAGFAYERWSNATIAAPANTAARVGSASGLAKLASATFGAAFTWADFDANGANGTAAGYYGGATPTATIAATPGQFGAYFGYQLISPVSTATFGASSPPGQAATLVGLELLPKVNTPGATLIETLIDDFTEATFDSRWPLVTSG